MINTLLGKKTYVRQIYGPGTYVDGEWVDGPVTVTTVEGSWQPITGEEREDVPSGYRTTNVIKFYSKTKLNIDNLDTGARGDLIDFGDGRVWEVLAVRDYDFPGFVTRHYKHTLAQLGYDE